MNDCTISGLRKKYPKHYQNARMWFEDENEIDFHKYCVAFSHLQ